ncbi:hypothetical protein HYW21_04830 [Candidatus Woesearchaeota archaeon]|nr:hypothetical protein [Candidatus Woesearchaeota archaeon]
MEIDYSSKQIAFTKELNALDRFVISFTDILNKQKIHYVIVSGYVAILFGRNRASEDVDIFIEKMSFAAFSCLWEKLKEFFICLQTDNPKRAYEEYLQEGYALRFSFLHAFIPNMELKFPKTDIDRWTLSQKKKTLVNNNPLYISSIEMQIAFKLSLGSEKDIEDARYLYNIFEEFLDKDLLDQCLRNLNIPKRALQYLP